MYCLRNYKEPNPCPWKYTLNLSGSLDVADSDADDFCKSGCMNHTRAVLDCIDDVKRDFWFANKASVKDLNDVVNSRCNTH
ncbi:hypothetical protein Leryth_013134 [Lithospermum erythrorhizon]|nr:hypothetical protein Leryth_013134 [Lithospermum erythrorhizon]